ncbi:glutathione gamma-glutamylcysteinyltransferase 3-like isoform X2 [Pomacea canaliculata]|nr:glutathione gamma-glutamylcysteinyltransferase 3-like isoform X2 [Pomacea canaliculata]XP_025099564.1 glutathione gamma-glutamylcysteinyltransferase 3-like isoform X2 [Pomacea canaliculata]
MATCANCHSKTACQSHVHCMGEENHKTMALANEPVQSLSPKKLSAAEQFYRRPLPETCISFASEEGKKIFMEALSSGYMNCYFRLASQFRTQDEPAYCGLATLVMALNALEIDPGRVWKGPWKWYHEDMLDCCISTELVRVQGITFDQFICLANCNSLDTDCVRCDDSTNEKAFRDAVQTMTQREDAFLIVSYSRRVLSQTGDGHFAPVSGYHPGRDLVLILDTARFKYPPHWVPLTLLFQSMQALDKETGLQRGYIRVWPAKDAKSLLLFRVSEGLSVNSSSDAVQNIQYFLSMWIQLLTQSFQQPEGFTLDSALTKAIEGMLKFACTLSQENLILTTQQHITCNKSGRVQCIIENLLAELEKTPLFTSLNNIVSMLSKSDVQKLENIFGVWHSTVVDPQKPSVDNGRMTVCSLEGCDLTNLVCLSHLMAIFLLSWPYTLQHGKVAGNLGGVLHSLVQQTLFSFHGKYLFDEVSTLRRQMTKLMGFHAPSLSGSVKVICDRIKV